MENERKQKYKNRSRRGRGKRRRRNASSSQTLKTRMRTLSMLAVINCPLLVCQKAVLTGGREIGGDKGLGRRTKKRSI
jgi:hypothetical protein